MPTREREIQKRVRELLESAGAKVVRTNGQGEPDLIGTYKGFGFAIEVKQVGKKPTTLQEFRIQQWKKAGAIAFWTDFPAQALVYLDDEVQKRIRKIIKAGRDTA